MSASMDPSRHERISELFLAACELPRDEREEFLSERCGDDAELRRCVEELLQHDADQAPVDRGLGGGGWARDALTEIAASALPERVGDYEILGLLGEGGMGIVYRARQRKPEREVALKVVRAGFASPDTLRRFEVEASLLGRLRHPGIAQIFEAGVAPSDQGEQPFFAMELVDGVALDQWLRDARPSTRDRLALIERVADAVAHAHHHGIAHRDLKPSNILIDAGGRPHVLDFGVARAVDEGAEETLLTRTGQLVGTLAYMSPEQASGDPAAVDVRTDVYSLGALLFEALTGRRPLEIEGLSLVEVALQIQTVDPPRLGAIDRSLRGDVDVIVAKALEKERERRYASAASLAQDLRRCLSDEPIEARPPSTIYQLSKLARRHRALFTGTAIAIVALLLGLTAALIQAQRATLAAGQAEQETKRAKEALAESDAVVDFLSGLLEAVHPDQLGREVRVEDVLERATQRLESEFDERPLVKARIAASIGRSWNTLGRRDQGRPALGVAVELFEEHLGGLDPRTIAARTRYAMSCTFLELNDEALAAYTRAYSDACTVFGPETIEALEIQAGLAGVMLNLGQLEEAERTLAQAVEIGERVAPEHPSHFEHMQSWAGLQRTLGRFDECVALARRAYDRALVSFGPNHWRTVGCAMGLGLELHSNGRFDEAVAILEPTYAESVELFGADHDETLYAAQFLGLAYTETERFEEAQALLGDAAARTEAKFGTENPNTLLAKRYLLQVPFRSGRFDEDGLALAREIAVGYMQAYHADHPEAIEALATLGRFHRSLGQIDEAEAALGEAVERARAVLPPLNPHRVQATNSFAAILRQRGRREEALEVVEEIAHASEGAALHSLGPIYWNVLEVHGTLLAELGREGEAVDLLLEARNRVMEDVGPDSELCIQISRRLLAAAETAGDADTAAAVVEEHVEQLGTPPSASAATLLLELARVYERAGRAEEAAATRARIGD